MDLFLNFKRSAPYKMRRAHFIHRNIYRLMPSILIACVLVLLLPAEMNTAYAQARSNQVAGVVLDAGKQPLVGVSIRLGNTNTVTTTDARGAFNIRGIDGFPLTLSFSYVGFIAQTLTIESPSNSLSIVLQQDNVLNEVVVRGYGESTREKLTSSITKIDGQTLVQQPIANPVLGLQGRVAGLYMTTPSGNLGANPTVVIRGDNTILSSANPLYIVDGVPMPSTGINAAGIGGATGTQSPFINLNSADIESVEVLKDADATAIYGTRGANGVILITTKKGKAGPTRVNVDVYRGYQQAVNKMDFLSVDEYLQMRRDAFAADGLTPTAVTAPDLLEWDQTASTDYQDLLFGDVAPVTDVQANIQGGNEQTTFILGLGYRDENGVVMNANNQKRGTARLNVNHRSTDKRFNVGATVNYTLLNTQSIGTSGVGAFTTALAPNLPLLDEETGLPYFHSTQTWGISPLRYTYSGTNLKNYQFIASGTIGYNILDNLNVKVDASYTRLDYTGNEQYRNAYLNPYSNLDYDNYAYFGTNYQYTYNIEPQVNYHTLIGNGKLTALVGGTLQQTIGGGQLINGMDFANELLMANLASASRIYSYTNSYNEYKFNSIFSRVSYDFADRYILNATFRRDGSSRFAPDRRFGNFWAIGGAWIWSKESFVKDHVAAISFAKLRASYGLTGNDAINNYQYMETFASTTYPYNYVAGMYANRLGNSQFRWESTHQFEVGLELNLFNNRITTTTAFFNKQGSNQLVNYPIATQTGWTSYVANLEGALIRNRGVEFEFTTHNIKGRDFNWRSNFNITHYKNVLVDFPNLSSSTYSNTYEVGKSINTYRRYEFDYVDPETGMPYVVDQNGDGVITAIGDYISYGTSDPSFYGGLGNTFSYKGFDLDIFFQFTKRPYGNGFLWNYYMPIGNMYNVPRFIMDEVWRSPEDPGTLPRLSTTTSGDFYSAYVNRYSYSTAIMDDLSFIRLKNLSLSYTFPAKVSEKLKLNNLRLYVLGQNLWTITGFKGFDPETGNTSTPLLKVYTLGLSVSL